MGLTHGRFQDSARDAHRRQVGLARSRLVLLTPGCRVLTVTDEPLVRRASSNANSALASFDCPYISAASYPRLPSRFSKSMPAAGAWRISALDTTTIRPCGAARTVSSRWWQR